jgi:SMI1 / KNR4 family (SUKH-1)
VDTEHADDSDLALLRAAFPKAEPFGWEGVRAFEAEHGVVLPEPYRTFTAEICGGGYASGPPDYGLVALGTLPDDWGRDRPERDLAKPFPLSETWIWEGDPEADEKPDELYAAITDHGSIVLGTDGCGMNWHLIVSGGQRGRIWQITGEGAAYYGAESGWTSAESGFTGWVRQWFEDRDWFDRDPEG